MWYHNISFRVANTIPPTVKARYLVGGGVATVSASYSIVCSIVMDFGGDFKFNRPLFVTNQAVHVHSNQ
jgi:hypothetical protein